MGREIVRLKADWFPYLHGFRTREFRLIFNRFPPNSFDRTLELGAGDGFQSQMLAPYTKSVVSTDFRCPPEQANPRIQVLGLSAEQIAKVFAPQEFDLVYSSNMFEHLPDPPTVLNAISRVLADDGLTIHVMPNRIWKLCQIALYVPHLVATTADATMAAEGRRALVDRLRKFRGRAGEAHDTTDKNNPTIVRPHRSLIHKALLPEPHGVSLTHREEFAAFSRRRWEAELKLAGFEIVAVLNGPFSSGYGFGARPLTRLLEQRGLGSEFVYVAKKQGRSSPHENAFTSGH